MIYIILGLLFIAIALGMDKAFRTELSPIVKYGLFAFALVFIIVDVFMFIETDRLINAHECCEECTENDTISCDQCCIRFDSYALEGVDYVQTVQGVYVEGGNRSFDNPDDYNVYMAMGTTTEVRIDFYNVPAYNQINVQMGTTNDSQMNLDIWTGSNWSTIWTFGGPMARNSFVPLNKYIINDTVQFRVIGTLLPNETYEGDWFMLSTSKPYYMYCSDTADTGTIIAWHYTEYAIIPLFINLLPYLGIFAGLVICIQYVYIWYTRAQDGYEGKKRD